MILWHAIHVAEKASARPMSAQENFGCSGAGTHVIHGWPAPIGESRAAAMILVAL